ncbi:MAG: type II toxin-antitoxin system RelE/ParE family toxin [Longimicrobiales bacterium]
MTYKYQYNGLAEKSLAFVGSSREDLRSFPADARRRAGFELDQVQRGLMPTDWRPMTSIGPGVMEIRIHTGLEHRVFYLAKLEEAVYVLHAFEKKAQKTSRRDLALARARLSELLTQGRRERK